MASNRIRELRKARGLSGEELAQATGTSVQQIYRLETGARRLTIEWVRRLAKGLGCSEYEFLPESAPKGLNCAVLGYIADQQTVTRYEKKQALAPAVGGRDLAAVEVLSVSLRPRYDEGDLLYFERQSSADPQDCIGQECLLELERGGLVLRTVIEVLAPTTVKSCGFGSYRTEIDTVRRLAPVQWVLRAKSSTSK